MLIKPKFFEYDSIVFRNNIQCYYTVFELNVFSEFLIRLPNMKYSAKALLKEKSPNNHQDLGSIDLPNLT
jgi:hypothetical protein